MRVSDHVTCNYTSMTQSTSYKIGCLKILNFMKPCLVCKLQQILHRCNHFVDMLRQLALCSNVHECSLLIKECPSN